jgi:hypothetical protein
MFIFILHCSWIIGTVRTVTEQMWQNFRFCRRFVTCSCMHFLPWAGDSSSQPHILFHYKGATESLWQNTDAFYCK